MVGYGREQEGLTRDEARISNLGTWRIGDSSFVWIRNHGRRARWRRMTPWGQPAVRLPSMWYFVQERDLGWPGDLDLASLV